jgi:hypothetical protein
MCVVPPGLDLIPQFTNLSLQCLQDQMNFDIKLPKLKTAISGIYFQSDNDAIQAEEAFLADLQKHLFHSGIDVLKHHCKMKKLTFTIC